MAPFAAAVRSIRRPVTALLVAAVAFVVTVTVFPWPQRVDDSLAAGLATPSASVPASGRPASLAPDPTASATARSTPAPAIHPAPTPTTGLSSTAAPVGTTKPFDDPRLRAKLQARLDKLRARYAIPGISVTIILDDGSTWTGVSGMADVRRKVAVEPDTAFAIASVSKTYTAALIMALADDGALDLDTPVAKLLPTVRVAGKATVRQLLDHTSGLPDYFLHGKIDRALFGDRKRTWGVRDTLKYVGKPVFRAGKGWYYSNTNYYLLGLVAEKVGGRPLGEQLRTRFLDPLGLDHTFEQVGDTPLGPLAHGYRVTGTISRPTFTDLSDGSDIVPFTSVVTAASGAGSMAATSPDVARWARALYRGEVLGPEAIRAMVADAKRTARFRPRVPYGLGVQLVPLDGRRALGHSGRLAGFRSVVRHLPGEGITICVLTNEAKQDPTIIARALLRIVSPKPTPSPAPTAPGG